jgi:membrane-associated protease RseP (regulator of RpoE activity)
MTRLFLVVALVTVSTLTACAQHKQHPGAQVYTHTLTVKESNGAWLGVNIQDMTRRIAKRMDVSTLEGALVTSVLDDSPAEEAGIRDEDIIIEVEGKKITDADELREVISGYTPGTKVGIVLMRTNDRKTLTATLEKSPRTRTYSFAPSIPHPPGIPFDLQVFVGMNKLGMSLSKLNKQLGKYFEAPNGRGVLVQEVEKESPAEKAGILAGDVIVGIGKETIEEPRDIEYAVREYKEGEKATVEVIRKGTKKSLTLEVPDMGRRSRWHSEFAPKENGNYDFDFELPELEGLRDNSFRNDMRDLQEEMREMGKSLKREVLRIKNSLVQRVEDVIG